MWNFLLETWILVLDPHTPQVLILIEWLPHQGCTVAKRKIILLKWDRLQLYMCVKLPPRDWPWLPHPTSTYTYEVTTTSRVYGGKKKNYIIKMRSITTIYVCETFSWRLALTPHLTSTYIYGVTITSRVHGEKRKIILLKWDRLQLLLH